MEYGSSIPDMSEKLARLSTDDTSLTDWHLGFHIFLVFLSCLLHCLCFLFVVLAKMNCKLVGVENDSLDLFL